MSEVTSMYLKGLGEPALSRPVQFLLNRQRRAGLNVVTPFIDWRSRETFIDLRDRITEEAQALLAPMSESDRLLLNGASAGVCLVLAVRQQLDDRRVRVIGHSGRVRRGDLKRLDWRTLERCAHLGNEKEESGSFFDGVIYCEHEVIPNMTPEFKLNTILTVPFAGIDEVVPGSTMPIAGVRSLVMPTIGHVLAIGQGLNRVPEIMEQLP